MLLVQSWEQPLGRSGSERWDRMSLCCRKSNPDWDLGVLDLVALVDLWDFMLVSLDVRWVIVFLWLPWFFGSTLVFNWSGLPVVPFYPFLGEGSPSKIDYRKKGTLILTSLLEDLGMFQTIERGHMGTPVGFHCSSGFL